MCREGSMQEEATYSTPTPVPVSPAWGTFFFFAQATKVPLSRITTRRDRADDLSKDRTGQVGLGQEGGSKRLRSCIQVTR